MNKVELWPVVDNENRIKRYATEAECHGTPKLQHRTVFIAAFDKKGRILLQQRSQEKSLYPGYYTLSATGHVIEDESYEDAAKREFKEELGIEPSTLIEVVRTRIEVPEHPSWSVLYKTIADGPFRPREAEVENVVFFDLPSLPAIRERITPPSRVLLAAVGWLK